MKIKKDYICPTIEIVCLMEEHCLLETISLGEGSGPATGGGDAKQGFFDEEEEMAEDNSSVWEF